MRPSLAGLSRSRRESSLGAGDRGVRLSRRPGPKKRRGVEKVERGSGRRRKPRPAPRAQLLGRRADSGRASVRPRTLSTEGAAGRDQPRGGPHGRLVDGLRA